MKQMCLSLVDVVILNPGNTVSKHRITRLSESQSSNYIQLRIPKYWEDSFLILKSSEKKYDNYFCASDGLLSIRGQHLKSLVPHHYK